MSKIGGKRNRGAAFVSDLLQVGNSRAEGQWGRSAARRYGMAAIVKEAVADEFGLLLEPVTVEATCVFHSISIAAERMAHQR